jgi:hypothetical protein
VLLQQPALRAAQANGEQPLVLRRALKQRLQPGRVVRWASASATESDSALATSSAAAVQVAAEPAQRHLVHQRHRQRRRPHQRRHQRQQEAQLKTQSSKSWTAHDGEVMMGRHLKIHQSSLYICTNITQAFILHPRVQYPEG